MAFWGCFAYLGEIGDFRVFAEGECGLKGGWWWVDGLNWVGIEWF